MDSLLTIRSLEAFARICVLGFLFDPEIEMSSIFSAPSSTAIPSGQTSLARGHSITQRFRRAQDTLLRPFALYSRSPAPTQGHSQTLSHSAIQNTSDHPLAEKILNVVQSAHDVIRNAPEKTFMSRAMRSDVNDSIALPFRLSVQHIHDKVQRGLPYLRQSWNRIDFVAIVSFWIMFALANAGVERGRYHIGLFRAMSVIRTARLLTITSGTTVNKFSQFLSYLTHRY
jgi:hypothetical protein